MVEPRVLTEPAVPRAARTRRTPVSAEEWQGTIDALAGGRETLLALWGETDAVHMAVLDGAATSFAVISLNCRAGRYPSVGATHAPAIRLERALRDLVGLEPVGLRDVRPWLDHGRWGVRQPLGRPAADRIPATAYPFLPAEGEGLHQIPVGPVHAGIIEPGHFRFTANGETVVRLEERLGYVHKGTEGLMRGATIDAAAKLAGRISGDSTVAYAIAFAQAIEAALGAAVPQRAVWLRAVMAELERIANHLGDIGAVCNDAAFALMHAHCGVLRERVLRTAAGTFGHRLMMDRVVPGGVAVDLDAAGADALQSLIALVRREFPPLIELFENTSTLQDRMVGTGILSADLAGQFAAGGFVGRASGRDFDARKAPAYPPYDVLFFTVPVLPEGDVNARVWIRIREIEQSLSLLGQLLDRLPTGPFRQPLTASAGEGCALVEGFRGDIFCCIRLDADGRIGQCRLRDPSWFQWPLLEAVIDGNIVADFPLCNKSFNCSYSGHDL